MRSHRQILLHKLLYIKSLNLTVGSFCVITMIGGCKMLNCLSLFNLTSPNTVDTFCFIRTLSPNCKLEDWYYIHQTQGSMFTLYLPRLKSWKISKWKLNAKATIPTKITTHISVTMWCASFLSLVTHHCLPYIKWIYYKKSCNAKIIVLMSVIIWGSWIVIFIYQLNVDPFTCSVCPTNKRRKQ